MLALAVPIMLANISTPLIGIVDTGVVGQLSDPSYIGAVAVGALIFSLLFWTFGFLRMGTTGLAAQSAGAADEDELAAVLLRALLVAGLCGSLLIALQWPIREAAFGLVGGTERVSQLGQDYFNIRIWAAPFSLANYALIGWFVGIGRTRIVLLLQLVLNLSNIALDALFVLVFEWDVRGVAAGTVVAEALALIVGLTMAWRALQGRGIAGARGRILVAGKIRRMLAINRDLMLRSLALVSIFFWFTADGARQGETALAANAVLMHLVSASAYILDGLAHAAESLVGRAIGAGDHLRVGTAVRMTTIWAVACAVVASLVIAIAGGTFIDLMTIDITTRAAARVYLPWAIAAPLLGVWAYQLDGIFIGATATAEMRQGMLVSFVAFVCAWWLSRPFGNHGLWAALSFHYAVRAISLWYYYPAVLRRIRTLGGRESTPAAVTDAP
mgnify:CR=1 FL=1